MKQMQKQLKINNENKLEMDVVQEGSLFLMLHHGAGKDTEMKI